MNLRRRDLAMVIAGLAACKRKVPEAALLPDVGQLPPFQLTNSRGQSFAQTGLAGNVWIMDFIFTRCTTVCPRMSDIMRNLQNRFEQISQLRLLSVSIDPDYDTIPRLAEY